MKEKLCRLCFEEKPKRVSIFGGKGVQQKIAEVIRMHFADAVNEDDHMPQSICQSCWTKLDNFHRFYIAVNEAKDDFLLKFVKIDEPNFTEINCDFSDYYDDDMPALKLEPEVVVAEIKTQPLDEDEKNFDLLVEMTKENIAPTSPGTNDDYDDRDFSDDAISTDSSDDDSGSEYDPVTDGVVQKPVKSKKENSETVNENPEGEFDHLISNFMDMFCEVCKHPFETLLDAAKHYRKKHKQRTIYFKCCKRKLKLPGEVREHIQFHTNPDIFKCGQCGKNCVERQSLKNHEATHSRDRFECDYCQKVFITRSGIHTHMLTKHAPDQEVFECEICQKRFTAKTTLRLHVKQVHELRDQQVCHICAKVYKNKQNLHYHLKNHNEVKDPRVNCEICNISLKNQIIWQKHMKRAHGEHSNIELPRVYCSLCGKSFKDVGTRRRHLKRVHKLANVK